MKATGIVRRIDELGRIVIPKEIRRTLRIREGDPLEIYTDREGGIILKKYSPIGELASFAVDFSEALLHDDARLNRRDLRPRHRTRFQRGVQERLHGAPRQQRA